MVEQKINPTQFMAQPMKTVKVRDNIYMTTGGAGANTGFFAGKNSVLVIDAKMTFEAGSEFIGQIKEVAAAPLTQMVITHSDLDHVNGLAAFPKTMKITAHKNTRNDMEQAFDEPELKVLSSYLPNDTFENGREFIFDGIKVKIFHFGPAHTSGDAVVFFPKERVVFAGDLITFGRDPLIHITKHGSSFGLVKNLKSMLEIDADIFIPGHNDPCGKKEIQGLIETVAERQAKVRELVQQGKSLEQVKEILKAADRILPSGRRFPCLEEAMYLDITEKAEKV